MDKDDPTNTTIFLGGLASFVTEEDLAKNFVVFGDIISVKYIPVKACAFIQYKEKSSGEAAIKGMNGKVFGAGKIRVSWGRAPSDMPGASKPKPQALPVFRPRIGNVVNNLPSVVTECPIQNCIPEMNRKYSLKLMNDFFKFESLIWEQLKQ